MSDGKVKIKIQSATSEQRFNGSKFIIPPDLNRRVLFERYEIFIILIV